jgi:hypothetical protein
MLRSLPHPTATPTLAARAQAPQRWPNFHLYFHPLPSLPQDGPAKMSKFDENERCDPLPTP